MIRARNVHGRFFRVDMRCWAQACELGLDAALAYLAFNAGRRGRQPTTLWGRTALCNHLGLSRSHARLAMQRLEQAGLVVPAADQKLVRRVVESKAPDHAYLPQSLVLGAVGERTPLTLLREAGDELLLRLFVELYQHHELLDEDGLPLRIAHQRWEKSVVSRSDSWCVVAFMRTQVQVGTQLTPNDPLLLPHAHERDRPGHDRREPFLERLTTLSSHLGLLVPVPRLTETDDVDSTIAFSVWPAFWRREEDGPDVRIGIAAQATAQQLIDASDEASAKVEALRREGDVVILPVPAHMVARCALWTGFRMRYRPHTKATSAWRRDQEATATAWELRFAELSRFWSSRAIGAAAACRI